MYKERKTPLLTEMVNGTSLAGSSISPMYVYLWRFALGSLHELAENRDRLVTVTERETKLIKEFTISFAFSQAIRDLTSNVWTIGRFGYSIGSGKGFSAFPGSGNTRIFFLGIVHCRWPVEGWRDPRGCAIHLS